MTRMTLTDGWRFFLGEKEPAWQKDFDDSAFTPITVPHDWSVTLPFAECNSSGTGYVTGGIGWYRCHFTLPDHEPDGRIRLCFDGVYKHASVWLNGYYLGKHANGFTPFSFDITDFARANGEDNVVSVRVDHREIADCRWYTGSGITRKVTLDISPAMSTAPQSVFFHTVEADNARALVRIEAVAENRSEHSADVVLLHVLFDESGRQVLSLSADAHLLPEDARPITLTGTVEAPRLWSPERPALYTLRTYLGVLPEEAADGPTADAEPALTNEMAVGLRTFRFDPDEGFFLNGKNTKIKGVCLHDDCGALGAAATSEIWYRRLVQLKEMGCNAIRMSHNPHMEELYSLCDALGFLVMDEAFDEWEAPKNKWTTGHNVYPPRHEGYFADFHDNFRDDIKAMILRDRNHPSVILWSIGNEIDYPNDPYCHQSFAAMTGNNDANKPAAERLYNPDKPNAERLPVLATMLSRTVRELDMTHPVILAAAFPELSAKLGFLDSLDVAGYNYKEQLYEESHRMFPRLPLLGSENGHSLEAWKAVRDNAYISGQFLWTGIDYLGEAHGWPVRASAAGLLTLAGFKKSGFYRRQSFWTDAPMAHLVTARADDKAPEWRRPFLETWNYRPGELIEVRCYTNQVCGELILDDKSLGVAEKTDDSDCLRWVIPYAPGKLIAEVYDSMTEVCGPVAADAIETVHAACALTAAVYDVPESYWQSENPIRQVEMGVTDGLGRPVATGSSRILVTVENGTLLGLENGDVADVTPYTAPYRCSFHGSLLAFVRRADPAVPAVFTAQAEELGSICIEV